MDPTVEMRAGRAAPVTAELAAAVGWLRVEAVDRAATIPGAVVVVAKVAVAPLAATGAVAHCSAAAQVPVTAQVEQQGAAVLPAHPDRTV